MAGEPAYQSLELQNTERCHDLRGSEAGAKDQLIDADGMVVEVVELGHLLRPDAAPA